jgi:hypothetical protein
MGTDIAVNRISCKPQKLQAMSATVKIGRGSWRQVGQAGRKKWLPSHGPIVEPSWIGRRHGDWQGDNRRTWRLARAPDGSGSAAVCGLRGEDEQDQAA